jgi:hypothetical protein
MFWTEWQQVLTEFNHLLIFTEIKFWFVTVVRKNLKYTIFSLCA